MNSELEMFIEDIESGSISRGLDELEDGLNSLEELDPKLSRSMKNDLKEVTESSDDSNY